MKKVLFTMLALVLAIGLAIPMAMPVAASPATMSVYSDTSVLVTGVYNKGVSPTNFVDLSGSPMNALEAYEPKPYPSAYPVEPPETTNSIWDTNVNWSFQTNAPNADWIWETHLANDPSSYDPLDPLYDAAAAKNGRVVLFEKTFIIPGNPTSATLHIAADNAYEFRVNSGTSTRSATAKVAGWELTNLKEANVATSGWQSVGHYNVVGDLQSGSNTLYVLAGNEYYWTDDGNGGDPVWYNPGALIFQLNITYETISISLTPEEAYNAVGTDHTVTATITPAVADIPITFVVTGANSAGPTVVNTDSNGQAQFTYTGANSGVDTITAYIDYNGDVELNVGQEPYDTATKTWFWNNFVTGGGNIAGSKKLWTFGGNVGYLEDGTLLGQFQIVDHTGKESWHCHNDFDSLIFWGDPTDSPPVNVDYAAFVGTFTSNKGNTKYLRVEIWDDQEPGRDWDYITVNYDTDGDATTIDGALWFLGNPISGGNFQIHEGFK